MRLSFGHGLPRADGNRPQQAHRGDTGSYPGAVLGFDLARSDVHDVRLDRIGHRANLVAIIREREHYAASTRANSLNNRTGGVIINCFGEHTWLGYDHANKISARL